MDHDTGFLDDEELSNTSQNESPHTMPPERTASGDTPLVPPHGVSEEQNQSTSVAVAMTSLVLLNGRILHNQNESNGRPQRVSREESQEEDPHGQQMKRHYENELLHIKLAISENQIKQKEIEKSMAKCDLKHAQLLEQLHQYLATASSHRITGEAAIEELEHEPHSAFAATYEHSKIESGIHTQEYGAEKKSSDESENCSPVEESGLIYKDSIVTGMQETQHAGTSQTAEEGHDIPPGCDGSGILIATPIIPHTGPEGKTQSHMDEGLLMVQEIVKIAPCAKIIYYPCTDLNCLIAFIEQSSKDWPLEKRRHTLHTFIVNIPVTWKYSHALEAAINRAQEVGILLVCAAQIRGGRCGYPAALGCCFSIGEPNCDGNVVYRGTIDYVEPGKLAWCEVRGSSISAARFTGLLALVCQCLFEADCCNNITPVLKEVLLYGSKHKYSSSNGHGRAAIKPLLECPPAQIMKDMEYITFKRDRYQFPSTSNLVDAKANTARWSSPTALHPSESLMGQGVTLAMIDNIRDDYLTHLRQDHGILISHKNGVKYFYISAKDVMRECCKCYHSGKQGHILQCAAIIGCTVPDCRLLLIEYCRRDDPGEKLALAVVGKEKPHILLVSGITTDVYTSFSTNLGSVVSSCIVICAAGNEGQTDNNTLCYPARVGNLIVVGACDCFGKRCSYSSVGQELTFLCPGQFDVADSTGRGGTCYAAAAAGAMIARLLQHIGIVCKGECINTSSGKRAVFDLACNTQLMKELLYRAGLYCRQEHSPSKGFGMLKIENIPMLTAARIMDEMRKFFHT